MINLTIGQLKELTGTSGNSELPFEIGKKYLFRTVTHIDVGLVKNIVGNFVVLEQASWIANTGRYHDCLSIGVFSEVEPYPVDVYLNTASLVDAAEWIHDLPTEQQ